MSELETYHELNIKCFIIDYRSKVSSFKKVMLICEGTDNVHTYIHICN
jgi:hypothetical protein